MTHPMSLDLSVFSGTFAFDDRESVLVQGTARAILMLDNAPSGTPSQNGVTAARSYFLGKGLAQGAPLTVVGFKGFLGDFPVIHVVRG
jgi:hypothetical protein